MVKVEGLAAVEARLAAALATMKSNADAAMHENALDLMGKAQQAAPYEKGALEGSAAVHGPESGLPPGTYEVGFYSLPYAWIQHERLDFVHPVKGQAKYLEGPFNENVGRYIENVRRKAQPR